MSLAMGPAWTSPPRGDPRDCQPTQPEPSFNLLFKGFVLWLQEGGDGCAVLGREGAGAESMATGW